MMPNKMKTNRIACTDKTGNCYQLVHQQTYHPPGIDDTGKEYTAVIKGREEDAAADGVFMAVFSTFMICPCVCVGTKKQHHVSKGFEQRPD